MPRPPVDKSLGRTIKLLTLPVLITAAFGYAWFMNWHGWHLAEADCAAARAAPSAAHYRAYLQQTQAPWTESRDGPEATSIISIYPGLGMETVDCTAYVRGGKVVGTDVVNHD